MWRRRTTLPSSRIVAWLFVLIALVIAGLSIAPAVQPTAAADEYVRIAAGAAGHEQHDYGTSSSVTTPTASTHHRRSAPRTRAGGGIAGVDARIVLSVATKGSGRSADNLPPTRGGAPGAGGRASKLRPNDDALGPHTVFRRGQDGRIDKYTIFDDFGNETLRFRGSGGSHAGLDPPLFYGAKPGKGPGAPLNRARNPGPDDYQNLPPGY